MFCGDDSQQFLVMEIVNVNSFCSKTNQNRPCDILTSNFVGICGPVGRAKEEISRGNLVKPVVMTGALSKFLAPHCLPA